MNGMFRNAVDCNSLMKHMQSTFRRFKVSVKGITKIKELLEKFSMCFLLELEVYLGKNHVIGIVPKNGKNNVIDGAHPDQKPFLLTDDNMKWVSHGRDSNTIQLIGFMFWPTKNLAGK